METEIDGEGEGDGPHMEEMKEGDNEVERGPHSPTFIMRYQTSS